MLATLFTAAYPTYYAMSAGDIIKTDAQAIQQESQYML